MQLLLHGEQVIGSALELSLLLFPGGRGIAVGPILSEAASDIFCDNENGANFLFQNQGDGTFIDVAPSTGEYAAWPRVLGEACLIRLK